MSMIDCQEALSTARGDHRDPPEVRAHLSACSGCSTALQQIRAVAIAARSALAMTPAPDARRAFERARATSDLSPWLLRYAFATAATAAAIAILIATKPSPPTEATAAATPKPFVLEFPPPVDDRVHYVVHGPAGSRDDVVVPRRHYVLETVPPNAVVVVDTF